MLLKIETEYYIYDSLEDLSEIQRSLLLRAKQNTHHAYAPYSKFYVGAAILTDDGKVIDGSNHENAAYPMCLCAEQVAIANFHQHRTDQKIKSIAISARTADKLIDSPVPPCGA
ncbi:MAG TPA: cytidine deaminase, partial [Saprospiraceae bacterium]|nr:cytidine deaminase [Saprospiraceae bacterium]